MVINAKGEGMPSGAFATVIEGKHEGPLLMEAVGSGFTYDSAGERAEKMRQRPDIIRTCVVQLRFFTGNELLFSQVGGAPLVVDFDTTLFGFIIEKKSYGPTLWEGAAGCLNEGRANEAYMRFASQPDTIRACIVGLTFAQGNHQLFLDLERINQ
jgi:hypothetical protein